MSEKKSAIICCLCLFICIVFISSSSTGTTLISGNISGTWTRDGSPYRLIQNGTVPSGQELIIEPGVIIEFAEGLSLNVYGWITAIGTTEERITFKSINENFYWNRLYIQYCGELSRLKNCDFTHATKAVYMKIGYKSASTMNTEIMNCTFRNCVEAGIYGDSHGVTHVTIGKTFSRNPDLNPIIENCILEHSKNGVIVYAHGYDGGMYYASSVGKASPIVRNCIFNDIDDTAFTMITGSQAGYSEPVFINNTVKNCGVGISAQSSYDATVKNNIFYGNNTGVIRPGNLSSNVSYNCLSQNGNDFVGYPSLGSNISTNINGTACDIAFNILSDPILDENGCHIDQNSPCIDAGDNTTPFMPEYDFENDVRIIDGDRNDTTIVDIGADEVSLFDSPTGDLNNDGEVDIADYSLFRTSYGTCYGDDQFILQADFDKDNCININDYRIFRTLL